MIRVVLGPEALDAEEIALLHQKMRELAVLGNIVESFTYQTISRCLVTIEAKDTEIASLTSERFRLAAELAEADERVSQTIKFYTEKIVAYQPAQREQ